MIVHAGRPSDRHVHLVGAHFLWPPDDQEHSPVTIEDTSRLASLGWDAQWAAAFQGVADTLESRDAGRIRPARVVAEHRQRYDVVAGGRLSR